MDTDGRAAKNASEPYRSPARPAPIFSGRYRWKTWNQIDRTKKRVLLQCRHQRDYEGAPRSAIGGLTRDRVYDLTGDGWPLKMDVPDRRARLPCPDCGAVWRVPIDELKLIADHRGHRFLLQLIDLVPGVTLELEAGSG